MTLKRLPAPLYVLLLSATFVVLAPNAALACSCEGISDTTALKRSKVVFAGTLSRVQSPFFGMGGRTVTYGFDVDTVVKGEVHERALMTNFTQEESSCSSTLTKGKRYLVYGDDPEKLSYQMCDPTHTVGANEEIAGDPPLPGGPTLDAHISERLAWATAAAILLFSLHARWSNPLVR